MSNVVHFNMIVEINQFLKDKGIEYSIHSVGGCTCAGLLLRQDGKQCDIKMIVSTINDYLDSHWMKVISQDDHPMLLDVVSKFPYENK